MSLEVEPVTGFYVYSFLRASDRDSVEACGLTGIEGAPVSVLAQDELAVAVSPIPVKKIRPQRKFLAAHQDVVTRLSSRWSMLPVAFGLIADDESQVRRILQSNESILQSQIDRVAGQVEMTVTLRWTAESIARYFVERYPVLSDARDRIAAGLASREEQIEMGRAFEQLMNQERAQHTATLSEALRNVTKEIEPQPVTQESEVAKLACLIGREREQEFNEAVYRAAENFSDDFAISFNGPWPPYSFVKLALSME